MEARRIFEERRAVNFFDPKQELESSTLQAIINLAVLAPSAFNLQPWRVIAVKSAAGKQRLYHQASNQAKILEAPVTLIIIGDRAGYEAGNPVWDELADMQTPEKLKETQDFARLLYGTSEERRIKFAESNAGLLAMSIMYAAKCFGVDSHPMSGIDFSGIKTEFSLQAAEEAVMLVALGYFDHSKTLYPRRKRRGYADIVEEA